MGIPSYFSYIVKNHSRIIQRINNLKNTKNTKNNSKEIIQKINHLYLDCNSIIYDAIHNIDFSSLTETDVKTIIRYVFHKIDEYILLISPDTNVIIAFDGVAPVAKLNQQRERRYKSHYQTQIMKTIFKDVKKDVWNTAAITPGTIFMKELNEQTQLYFKDPIKYGVKKIIVSASDIYGEGEHKIFQYMRHFPEEHTDAKTVIYGLDADLIMLSINHLPVCSQIYLFRETPHFIQNINKDLEPNENYLLDIPELARIITDDMNNQVVKEGSQPNRIYDYIFLCFFLGNDFLPHFPAINIRTGGVDKMINAYKATLGGTPNILTDGKTIYWKNVRTLVQHLANLEEEYLKNEIKLRDKREKIFYPIDTPENVYKKFDAIPTYERELEKYINPFRHSWKERYYQSLFPEHFSKKDEFKNGETWENEKIKEIGRNYLEGLEWTMKYYTSGCPNWRWSYKYHYPPLLCDLIHYIPLFEHEFVPKVKENPVHPLVQLCYVLPQESLSLLPSAIYKVLTTKHYEWYKTDCEFLWAFCKYFWESHVQLPEIEINELEKIIMKYLEK